jgi:uncharacterized protein YbaP (TraB family)
MAYGQRPPNYESKNMSPSLVRLPALLSSFLVVSFFGVAAAPAPPQKARKSPAPVQQPSGGKHCLWRVTDASAPVYLLGSIHQLRATDYPLAPVIEQAIEQSQQFFFEYDPKLDNAFDQKIVAAAKLPNGTSIKQKVRPETWKFLAKINRGDWYGWMNCRAWAIAFFFLQHSGYERVRSAYGLDNYVERRARAKRCPLYGLETVDDHVRVLSDMTDLESEVFLLQALVFADQGPKRFAECVAAWKAGNTQRIADLDLPDTVDVPLNPRLLYNRNARWISVIESAIKSGKPTLIVAGAMHFSGQRNVISMLRAHGYNVEQL